MSEGDIERFLVMVVFLVVFSHKSRFVVCCSLLFHWCFHRTSNVSNK